MDRVGVLIGHNGETKNDLEERLGIKINIDSKEGEVSINEQEIKNPLDLIKLENIIKAIGRGFSPLNAFRLTDDDADFFVFDLHDYVGKKESLIRRLKSRIIGKEGKTKRILEQLTDSNISVYGHTISVICDVVYMNILKKALDMMLTGSKHATVYRFVEAQMKELKRVERYGF